MDKVLEKIIEKLKLRKDFFERNPAYVYSDGKFANIVFEKYEIIMTRDEYENIGNRLWWGCVACCGFGSQHERKEGEYVILEGVPCMCHPTQWGWSMSVPL